MRLEIEMIRYIFRIVYYQTLYLFSISAKENINVHEMNSH